jgi:hypothetical protein
LVKWHLVTCACPLSPPHTVDAPSHFHIALPLDRGRQRVVSTSRGHTDERLRRAAFSVILLQRAHGRRAVKKNAPSSTPRPESDSRLCRDRRRETASCG